MCNICTYPTVTGNCRPFTENLKLAHIGVRLKPASRELILRFLKMRLLLLLIAAAGFSAGIRPPAMVRYNHVI